MVVRLIQISTRRFFSRPSSVSFEATGNSEPNPRTTAGFMPRWISWFAINLARFNDKA
jgi:hypothetical protein